MLIARALAREGDGSELLVFGLTRENLTRLKAGHPIEITTETHGAGVPLGWRILILYGESERTIAAEMRRMGAISDETKINVMPGGKGDAQ